MGSAGGYQKFENGEYKDDLSFINAQSKRVTEPGDFEVIIGDKKAGFRYEN